MTTPPTLPPLTPIDGVKPDAGPDDLGIVMGGGGARAAYQIGVLRWIARAYPDLSIPYVTGVSAGAINAAMLASHHGTFLQCMDELSQLWSRLTVDDVFRTGGRSLTKNVLRWSRTLLSGGRKANVRGLVDTAPLREYLMEVLHAVHGEITGVQANLDQGRLRALAISTSSYSTGQSVTWVQGQDIEEWERPQRKAIHARITVEHIMASAALPLFFPAIQLGNQWFGDGGMRLTAPLSPALHLGAGRVMAISTRYDRSPEEAERPAIHGYPPPAQVVGVLMNSIFLDLLDHDALRLQRLNKLLRGLPPEERHGLRLVRLLIIRPSEDLGVMADRFESDLPRTFRFLTRGLGTQETSSADFLSLVMFQPEYLTEMIRVGERDAEAQADEIRAFFEEDLDGDLVHGDPPPDGRTE